MSIGTGWVDGAWVDASWADGAWIGSSQTIAVGQASETDNAGNVSVFGLVIVPVGIYLMDLELLDSEQNVVTMLIDQDIEQLNVLQEVV